MKVCESLSEIGVAGTRYFAKQNNGHLLANDSGCLEPTLLFGGQPIDTRTQESVNAGRDLESINRSRQSIGAQFAGNHLRFHETADALLEKERVALRPLHEQLLQLIEHGVATKERLKQVLGTRPYKRIQAYLGVVLLGAPPVPVLRPVIHEQKHRLHVRTFDEVVEQCHGLAVSPMQVLDDEEQWL